jgi:hypothetical protein
MPTWNNAQFRLLPDSVARGLETIFAVGDDRCRHCRHFDPYLDARLRDVDEGRCSVRHGNSVKGGYSCEHFERKVPVLRWPDQG